MNLTKPKNENYCAYVVALDKFVDLPNCDNVKAALIYGNSVIVAKSAEPGNVGLFFPVETQLSSDFLANNNLYNKPELGNVNPLKKGFFELSGRVKAVKFRGHKSEGFWIPIDSLIYTGVDIGELNVGDKFDHILDKEICCKYVPKKNRTPGAPGTKKGRVKKRMEDRFVEGQFRFHIDTPKLETNLWRIQPTDIISITDKWHGTSAVFANVLVQDEHPWYLRWLQKLGVPLRDGKYAFSWSSRSVIKGIEESVTNTHYYGSDIWGTVANEVKDSIPKGYTVYGEIVGYTETGSTIQKGYHYGCLPKTHKFLVYRVTVTNVDGRSIELSWNQIKQFCSQFGLEHVKELYYGYAGELCPSLHTNTADWQEYFINKVKSLFVSDQKCPWNHFEVPAEGVVVRVDNLKSFEAFKVKSFAFLQHETKQLDKGEVDIETEESLGETEESVG